MLRANRRFVVIHDGSIVRPPAMIPYLQKAQAGEPYDKAEFESCLTDSVIEAVRLQAEAGIDVVSDGEYGKSGTWAFYVHRRLSGIEWRPFTDTEAKDPMLAVISGRDREAFPEFYAEYDARRPSPGPGEARGPAEASVRQGSPIAWQRWIRPNGRHPPCCRCGHHTLPGTPQRDGHRR